MSVSTLFGEGISPVNSAFSSASLSDTDIALPNSKAHPAGLRATTQVTHLVLSGPSVRRKCHESATSIVMEASWIVAPNADPTGARTRLAANPSLDFDTYLRQFILLTNISPKELFGKDMCQITIVTLSPFASLRVNSAKGLTRRAQRSFPFAALRASAHALRMT